MSGCVATTAGDGGEYSRYLSRGHDASCGVGSASRNVLRSRVAEICTSVVSSSNTDGLNRWQVSSDTIRGPIHAKWVLRLGPIPFGVEKVYSETPASDSYWQYKAFSTRPPSV